MLLKKNMTILNIYMTKQSEAKRKARLAAQKAAGEKQPLMLNIDNQKFLKTFGMQGVSLS